MTQKWWVLTAVACGTFMATLDSSIVNIALPTLTKELGTDLDRIKWVVIIYLLVITCLLLPFGLLSDQKGRKPVFQLGFYIFIVGSALCSLASELYLLIFFRAVQAVGASMLMANGPAIITGAFSEKERGAALGTLAMVVSAGLMMGPSFGGVLIAQFGWRSIFWINIPIGIIGIVLVNLFIKKTNPTRKKVTFDWVGAFLQTIFLLLFIALFELPISFLNTQNQLIQRGFILFLLLAVSAVFVKVESMVKTPLFDFSLLKNRTFWTSNLAGFLIFVAFSSVTVLMPFFLEEVLHFSPRRAGIFMTAIPVTIFIIAPISGRLSDRLGSKGLSFCGSAVGVFGLFLISGTIGEGFNAGTEHSLIIAALAMVGLALGLFQSPNNSAIMGCVPANKLGMASALMATVRNLGLVTGTGFSTALFTWRHMATGSFVSAFHTTLFAAGVIGIGALVATLGKRKVV